MTDPQPPTKTINGIEVTVNTSDYGYVSLFKHDIEYGRNLKAFLRDGNVMSEHDEIVKILPHIVARVLEYAKSAGFNCD